jgi:hypothetical protein
MDSHIVENRSIEKYARKKGNSRRHNRQRRD